MIGSGKVLFWYWWILGAIFIVIEMLAPGIFMLWLGVAAFAAGLVLLAVPGTGIEWQLIAFALVAMGSVVFWRRQLRRAALPGDSPNLNQRGQQYISRHFDLADPIRNGYGRAKVEDTIWTVSGPDLPAGSRVQVIGVDGTVLKVKAVDNTGTG